MTPHVSVMRLGAKDMDRAKEFYSQGHSSSFIGHVLP
jgi:predicted enzyme related to lactoylglutathione lyase